MKDDIYKGRPIKSATGEAIAQAIPDYEVMLVAILDAMLERYQRDPAYYFIDTKLSMLTGEDFLTPADDSSDYKGKTAVYGWIQGRGLESLVGHIRWLPECSILNDKEKQQRIAALTKMTAEVFERMEQIRLANGGRVWFVFNTQGRLFDLDANGKRRYFTLPTEETTSGDRFYVKGMIAAAALLNRQGNLAEAGRYLDVILDDIAAGRNGRDRFSFDPKNKVEPTPGKFGHGTRMISLGMLALAAELLADDRYYQIACDYITYILDRHVNTGQLEGLQPYDFVESIDAQGRPWREADGKILSDSGHCLEFVGLAAKVLLQLKGRGNPAPSQRMLLDRCADVLPRIFLKNFDNGFARSIGGIYKAFDLVSRTPINSDMPWWSLPETMRAGAELLLLSAGDSRLGQIRQAIADCSNAFVKNFVNPKAHLMAYQTVSAAGKPVDVIPATPDADPGYHTGLSIIDFIRCIRALQAAEKKGC